MSALVMMASAMAAPLLIVAWIAHIAHGRGEHDTRDGALKLIFIVATVIAIAVIAAVTMALMAGMALATPDMVRHGYSACSACHVAATGGGALTPYGRSVGPTAMSTWAADGEERPAWFVDLPDWIAVGGDARSVAVRTESGDDASYKRFVMQADAELAVSPAPPITFAASAGVYGPDHDAEFRRAYMKLAAFDGAVTARTGRFTPAYGVLVPDHRTPTRAGLGLGQGSEVFASELAITGSVGEVIVTEVAGNDATVDMADSGYALTSDSRRGVVGRGAVFLGDRCQLGASYLALGSERSDVTAAGVHLIAAAGESVYLLSEFDRRYDGSTSHDLGMARLGVVPIDGLHLIAVGQLDGTSKGGGLGLQWFPRPHLELAAEWQRIFTPAAPAVDVALIMAHHYL